ncbi:MAG: molecular chaperone TorD family protein [Hyphomicrobiales bacterium]|nr:molecular chaperone TorD family protein [Hyphomicrobiales bacterium]
MTVAVDLHPNLDAETRRGIAEDLRILALLHDTPPTAELIATLREDDLQHFFALPLVSERGREALDFVRAALAETSMRCDPVGLDEIAADHAAIYLNNTHRVSPSESPWIDPEGLMAQEPMFQVRDWYRHWGLATPDWRKRTDDHLVVQLGFLAHLLDTVDADAALVDAARFLDRHLLRWYPTFAERVVDRCWTAYWAAVAHLTAVHLETLRDRLARIEGCERIEIEPIEEEKRRRREVAIEETCASARAYAPGQEATW